MSDLSAKRSPDVIQSWITQHLANILYMDVEEIDIHESFHSYGLSSRDAITLSGDIEEWLETTLAPTLVWDYPTIAELTQHLVSLFVENSPPKVEALSTQAKAVPHPQDTHEPIAIIGIGCRFPGAEGPEEFWELLRSGCDAIREVPAERWSNTDFYDTDPTVPGKMNTLWGGFLEHTDQFDAAFFGIAPREAEVMDPQQRLLLEVAWEALADAGQSIEKLAGSDTGVFIGIATNDYSRVRLQDPLSIDAYAGTGGAFSIAANRLSYFFDWHGPSMAVDTACSSSLVALHLACQSLHNEEATLALAGGVNLIFEPTYAINFTKAGAMSPDGRCKAFAKEANGYVRSEGVGVVLLKPLSQALKDGDAIYALVRGSALSQDGRSNGLMAPSRQAQEKVLRQAYRSAGVAPTDIQYIEAHGTGTFLGDPIEAQALGNVLAMERPAAQPCLLGSVKTNIGHLEAAAGIAGVIKVALAMRYREIPPSLHFAEPNPHIPFAELALRVVTELTPWPSSAMLAGVSSFGFGGTNAHVVLAGAPEQPLKVAQEESDAQQIAQIFPMSARSAPALYALASRYQKFFSESPAYSWATLCANASLRQSHLEHRLALVACTAQEAEEQLSKYLTTGYSAEIVSAHIATAQRAKLVFVCPGQGSQWLGMGRELLAQEPVFYQVFSACNQALQAYISWSLLDELYAHEERAHLSDVDVVQPLLFAFTVALAALWRSWGVIPEAIVGHSMGEVAAAHIAGVLSLDDASRIIAERSKLLRQVSGQGAMLAVELSDEQLQTVIAGYEHLVSIAVNNAPRSCVLSGNPDALEIVYEQLRQRDVFCRWVKVDVASHSPQMEPLQAELVARLTRIQPRKAVILLYSTVHGTLVKEETFAAEYWGRNLRETVRFAQTISVLIQDGFTCYVELSPHPILTASIEQALHVQQVRGVALCSLRRQQDERRTLLQSVAALHTYGVSLAWSAFHPKAYAPVRLPRYPWQRQRYWVDVVSKTPEIYGKSTEAFQSQEIAQDIKGTSYLREVLANQNVTQQKQLVLEAHIREHIAQVLRMPLSQIDADVPLMALGLDSITALEVKKRLEVALALQLPTTLIWQFPTVRMLASYLCEQTKEIQ